MTERAPRPSARYRSTPRAAPPRTLEALHTAEVEQRKSQVLALFAAFPDREFYSVDVAERLGIQQGRAANLLRTLEAFGALTSRLCASQRSGLGRRYYQLRKKPCPSSP